LGGAGKSQLAREYLHQHHGPEQDEYPNGAFWLRGESKATLSGDLAALAWLPELQLKERPLREQEHVVEAVIGWLRAHDRWLVVIDKLIETAAPAGSLGGRWPAEGGAQAGRAHPVSRHAGCGPSRAPRPHR
jgi:hypothetical protein